MTKTKDIILQLFKKNSRLTTGELIQKLKITRQSINRHLNDLIKSGKIIRQGTSKATAVYVLNDPKTLKKFAGTQKKYKKILRAKTLSEDRAFEDVRKQIGLLDGLTKNDDEIFYYAFTEMLNNAIDHSGSKFINVDLKVNDTRVIADIIDKGIGAFENIRSEKKLESIMDAIQDLLKGKQTTAPKYHSGEGIFFTSKVVDKFVISCNGKRLIIDNRLEDVFIESIKNTKGTTVYFEIDLPSRKKLIDVFKKYTNEDFTFDRSKVSVKLFDSGDTYISRSQAKRLLHSMESFKSIELDFTGVRTVGQAFADEVFRVFQNQHPKIEITYKGANEDIEFMIKRALAKEG